MKKIIYTTSFLFILGMILTPVFVLAFNNGGLVPCGGEGQPDCTLCHLFVLIKNVFAFVTFRIVPAVAVIMIIWSGFYFLTSGGSQERVRKARTILTRTVVGIVIAYAAFLIVGTVLGVLSQAGTEADTKALFRFQNGNIIIECPGPTNP